MWHNLTHEEKEEYRRKAKVEEEEKLRKWTRETAVARKKLAAQQAQARVHVSNVAQAKMAQRQQQQMHRPPVAQQPAPIKRRRTNGYAIFTSEMRRELSGQYPEAQLSDAVAQSWREATPETKAYYEQRATRINAVEE